MNIDGLELPDKCPICGSEVDRYEQGDNGCPEWDAESGFIAYECGMTLGVTNQIELEGHCETVSAKWVEKRNARANS